MVLLWRRGVPPFYYEPALYLWWPFGIILPVAARMLFGCQYNIFDSVNSCIRPIRGVTLWLLGRQAQACPIGGFKCWCRRPCSPFAFWSSFWPIISGRHFPLPDNAVRLWAYHGDTSPWDSLPRCHPITGQSLFFPRLETTLKGTTSPRPFPLATKAINLSRHHLPWSTALQFLVFA